jgi:hypothetical protein
LFDLGLAAMITAVFSFINTHTEQQEAHERVRCELSASILQDEALNGTISRPTGLKSANDTPMIVREAERRFAACMKD